MTLVYGLCVNPLPDPLSVPRIMEGLPEERRKKILRFRQEKGRRQSLGAGLLLKYVMDEYGISMDTVHYGKNGKPEAEGICFNLSHSHEMVICAVSRKPVGCDIQWMGKAEMKVAEHFFCPEELAYLRQFEGEKLDEAFCRLWTMKESYIKMTGEGMSLSFRKFTVIPGETIQVMREGVREECFLKEYGMPGYRVTVCAEEKEFEEEIRMTDVPIASY